MKHKKLSKLCVIEEGKLAQLGEMRQGTQQRIETTLAQSEQLTQMISDYRICDKRGTHPLIWANSSHMSQALAPLVEQLEQKRNLLLQERARLDVMWKQQLGRQQGVKWYQGQCQQRHYAQLAGQEQKINDDLAASYTLAKR